MFQAGRCVIARLISPSTAQPTWSVYLRKQLSSVVSDACVFAYAMTMAHDAFCVALLC